RAMETGEALQPVQPPGPLESGGVQLHGMQRGIASRAAAGMLLQSARMRRAVGAQEEARAAAGGGLDQRLPVHFALENGQTIPMRPHPARKNGIAVVQQVLRRNGGADGPF